VSTCTYHDIADHAVPAWNWGAKAGFFYAGTNLLCLVWCWFRLPETKDRSFGEIDLLFENRVPARKFKYTKVDRQCHFRIPRDLITDSAEFVHSAGEKELSEKHETDLVEDRV
jgi:hypothetical protein